MGPKLSVSVRVAVLGGREGLDDAMKLSVASDRGSYGSGARETLAAVQTGTDYFLRKRSSRTTSAPSVLAGSSSFSGSGDGDGGLGTVRAEGAGGAGRLAAGASAAASEGTNGSRNEPA